MDEFLTVAEVAANLKVNQQTVRNWIDRGELPAVRVEQRRVRVRRADLDQFLESGPTAGVSIGEQAQVALSLILPAAIRGGLSESDLAELPGLGDSDWETLMTGGDFDSGVFRNLDLCPCHQCYCVSCNVIPLAAVPNPAQVPALLAYPPDPPPEDRCPDRCLHVKTHRWRSWRVSRNVKTGVIHLHCCSYAQYHCVLPDDPEGRRRPKEGPPRPDEPEA